MSACEEAIATTVLDGQEPLSYRSLSLVSQVDTSTSRTALRDFAASHATDVQTLHVQVEINGTSKPGVDPRSRTIRLRPSTADDSSSIYGIYSSTVKPSSLPTALWLQERQNRNAAFDDQPKQHGLTSSLESYYTSPIANTHIASRQNATQAKGEEAISLFDSIKAPKPSKPFFPASSKKSAKPKVVQPPPKKEERQKVDPSNMDNVLSVDSDSDSDNDAPKFVPKTGKRIIEDDEEEVEKPKSRSVKRKLVASPESNDPETTTGTANNESDEDVSMEIEVPTKRQVVVPKTRINEQGYMVTEESVEEVEMSAEEIAKEKSMREAKRKEQLATAKKRKQVAKSAAPGKQKDLRSFFMKQ